MPGEHVVAPLLQCTGCFAADRRYGLEASASWFAERGRSACGVAPTELPRSDRTIAAAAMPINRRRQRLRAFARPVSAGIFMCGHRNSYNATLANAAQVAGPSVCGHQGCSAMHGMETAQGEVVPPTNSRAKWTMPKTETGIPDHHEGLGPGRPEGPQPFQVSIDLPTRFIGHDDGTAANGLAERRIGRQGLAGRAMQRARDGAGEDG